MLKIIVMEEYNLNYQRLKNYLKEHKKLAIAYSGGVDSSVLLKVATDTLGKENILPIVCSSDFTIKKVESTAKTIAEDLGVNLHIICLNVMDDEEIMRNDTEQCYYCKRKIFSSLISYANDFGFKVLADGTNYSDDDATRPGSNARLELGVISPLKDCMVTKEDVREMAKEMMLSNAYTPSNSCLATRVMPGIIITEEILGKIHRAESELSETYDFIRLRVKYFEDKILLEAASSDTDFVMGNAENILEILREIFTEFEIGFSFV